MNARCIVATIITASLIAGCQPPDEAPGRMDLASEMKLSDPAKIAVVGFSVRRDFPDQGFRRSAGPLEKGVTAYILLQGQTVLDIDRDKSRVIRVMDDTGNRMDISDNGGNQAGIGNFPALSSDNQKAIFSVNVTELPAAGASRIGFEGVVAAQVASGKKTETLEGIRIENGAKVGWGDQTAEIVDAKEDAGNLTFSLRGSASLRRIVEIRLLDASGKARAVSQNGYEIYGNDATFRYSTDASPTATTLQIDFWDGIETREIPFAVITDFRAGSPQ